MKKDIILEINNETKIIGTSGETLENTLMNNEMCNNVIAALVNNEVVSLDYILKEDVKIELIKTTDRIGSKIYRNGLKFLYIVAIKELYGSNTIIKLNHSLDKGIYTTLEIDVTEKTVADIKAKMTELVNRNIKIDKVSTNRRDAIKYFSSIKETEKVENYKQMTSEVVTLYKILDYYNYFYSIMPTSTGILKAFDLTLTANKGIILQYPTSFDGSIPPYTHIEDVLKVFKEYREWSTNLKVNYISDVNNVVIDGKIKEFIELNEIKQNEDISVIANEIKNNIENIKLVLIAGPSSSGKTTTSKKLALYLKNKGINPFVISTDDYFKERKDTPKNEKGEYEFDILEAIDINLFNEKLTKLLSGEKVSLLSYNFLKGEKEYKNDPISLTDRDVIIIEGIHTLNEKLTNSIDRKNKYKIYISPFTPLGLDRHNHVSTVDLRLIRRLVRDNRTRGYDGEQTLKQWTNVRISEEKYIFPYQKEADKVLNTALIYELGVLKTYAMPILYKVRYNSDFYPEAIRILNFLKYFLDIPVDYIPNTSLLREFVGNGYFE